MTSTLLSAVNDILRPFWAGTRVLMLLQRFDASAGSTIDELASLGATVAAVVSAGPPSPDAPQVPKLWTCGADRLSTTEFDTWLRDPPVAFAAWLDEIDNDGSLTVLGNPFTHVASVFGRPVHGWRRPRWAAFEDKTRIDAFFDAAQIPSPVHVVLPMNGNDPDADVGLRHHFTRLDSGLGVIVAMDSSRRYLGGAEALRWVLSPAGLVDAVESCRGMSDSLRVAEFVPGVPCSVLALVLPGGVAVFDPIEIVTLRDAAHERLVFCGSSTWWRPGDAEAGRMREFARRTAAELAAQADYRGLLSIDGILTPRGFLATEVNPRHASGLGLRRAWPQFPLHLFQRAVQEAIAGTQELSATDFEETFRSLIRQAPSFSLRVPAPCAPDSSVREYKVAVGAVNQLVRYKVRDGWAQIYDITPPLPDGTCAPALAALSSELGAALTSFVDDVQR